MRAIDQLLRPKSFKAIGLETVLLISIVIVVSQFVGEDASYGFSYLVALSGLVIAAIGAWKRSRGTVSRRMWVALAAYWSIWAVGHVVYGIVFVTADSQDFTLSIADAVFILGAPILPIVAMLMPVDSLVRDRQWRAFLDAAILVCGLLLIVMPLVFEPLWREANSNAMERLFNFAYPFLSAVAVTLACSRITKHPVGGKTASVAVLVSLIAVAFYDATYAYFAGQDSVALAALMANSTIYIAMRSAAMAAATFDPDDLGQESHAVTTVWSVVWPTLPLVAAAAFVSFRAASGVTVGYLVVIAMSSLILMQSLRQISLVVENRRLAQSLLGRLEDLAMSEADYRFRALHDPLTKIPNRLLLRDRLEHALRRSSRDGSLCALLVVDLDGFKAINDGHGHIVGDQVLVDTANRFMEVVRPSDTVARLGGDEFAVLLENIHSPEEAELVAQRIVDVVQSPLVVERSTTSVGASVGIAVSTSEVESADQLLERADHAMYASKLGGKNCWTLWRVPSVADAYGDSHLPVVSDDCR